MQLPPREVHAVPAPQLSTEDGIALLAKTALEQQDQQLVDIAADIATAYGSGDPAQLEQAYLALSDHMQQLYAAGRKPPAELLRADHALQQAAGGYSRVTELRTARDQRAPQARPASTGTPRPQVATMSDRGKVADMLSQRDARQRDYDELRAHPDYQRQLAGAPDTMLSEDYIRRRRELFGKRLHRRNLTRR